MRTLLIAFLLCVIGIGCTTRMPKPLPDGKDLPSSFYMIDPMRDTTITTARGARLSIPAGAFGDSAAGSGVDSGAGVSGARAAGFVRVEVKEAYTIADIIRGRLVTTSKGMPLSSGGMIYINVAGGGIVKLRKPIKVAIPSKGLQEGMQVFKGLNNDKGEIDWVDPKPLLKTRADRDLASGKALFMVNCASCHGLGKAVTGPPLAWISQREADKKWLHDFIRNNTKLLGRNDPYACYLYNRYNKTPMNVFPDLSDRSIDIILNYIMNESQTIDSNTVDNNRRSFDSCRRYSRLKDSLMEKLRAAKDRRMNLVTGNGLEVVESRYAGRRRRAHWTPPPLPPFGIVVQDYSSVYYQFEIDDTGWFNVDILLKDLPGVEPSMLQVRIPYRLPANVYLVIPSVKVLMRGGPIPGERDAYGFYKEDEKKILLPQGVPAFILCMGEDKGQAFWGKVQWITGLSQELNLEPVAMSKEAIDTALSQLHIENLSIGVKDSKNAREIRELDTVTHVTDSLLRKLAGLKPQFCDCNCLDGEAEALMEKRDTAVFGPPVQVK